jgi:hypothetical protein
MRPILASLCVLAVALAAGCGGSASKADVVTAAEATRRAGTARVDVRITTRGFGLRRPVTLRGRGTTALSGARMRLDVDLGPVLARAGRRGDGGTQVVLRGRDLYVRPPAGGGLDLPGGAAWVALDLAEAVSAMGFRSEGLAEVVPVDPGAQLRALRVAEDVEELGPARVGRAETVRYRGTFDPDAVAAALPGERGRAARAALAALAARTPGADAPAPFEVWIDGRDRVRRLRQRAEVPAQAGVPAGEVAITIDLSGFGAPLDARAPDAAETFDATETVAETLARTASAPAGGAPAPDRDDGA